MNQAARHRLGVDERRKQLLDLALELFGNRPYDEISIDEIAKEAGVSKGLLYHYFSSKRAFFVAAVEAAAESLLESTEVETVGDVPTMDEMREGVTRYLDYVDRHARNYLLLVRGGDGVDEEVQAIVDRTRMAFLERVRDAAALLPQSPEVDITLRGYIGYVETVSIEWVEHKRISRDALADLIVRQCIALFSTVQR
ncbi:MAG: helix-turn-helix domain-containing protein [Polyangiales bacterium]|nr:TetR/AcrR family transcriptional regulator [Myxococcales bacterium]MCB9661273.1 TetR/AcrR family transcriptional regulator [Sandaracinaceae bacterium]